MAFSKLLIVVSSWANSCVTYYYCIVVRILNGYRLSRIGIRILSDKETHRELPKHPFWHIARYDLSMRSSGEKRKSFNAIQRMAKKTVSGKMVAGTIQLTLATSRYHHSTQVHQ